MKYLIVDLNMVDIRKLSVVLLYTYKETLTRLQIVAVSNSPEPRSICRLLVLKNKRQNHFTNQLFTKYTNMHPSERN